jgi:hypothetical protein
VIPGLPGRRRQHGAVLALFAVALVAMLGLRAALGRSRPAARPAVQT